MFWKRVILSWMTLLALVFASASATAAADASPKTHVGAIDLPAATCIEAYGLASAEEHLGNPRLSTEDTSDVPHAARGAAPALSKVLPTLGKMDARVVSRAAELAKGSTGFADDLAALARATGEVIPAGQVHALGQLGGQQVFGSAVSRIGIVASESGTLLVRSPLGEAVQVLGRFH